MKWKRSLGELLIGLAALTSPLFLCAALFVRTPIRCWDTRPVEFQNRSGQALYVTFLAKTYDGQEYPLLPYGRFALVERQRDIRLGAGDAFLTCCHYFSDDDPEEAGDEVDTILVVARSEEGEYRQYDLGSWWVYSTDQIPALEQMDKVDSGVLARIQSWEPYSFSRLYTAAWGVLPVALLTAGIVMLRRAKTSISMRGAPDPGTGRLPEDESSGSHSADGGGL